MLAHLIKLMSKQWKKNIWILIELFLVLSLLWYIVDYFSVLYINGRTPTGFSIENTYKVALAVQPPNSTQYIHYEKDSDAPMQNFLRIIERIRSHPDIESVSVGSWHHPYSLSSTNTTYMREGRKHSAQLLTVTPYYFDVFKVNISGINSYEQINEALHNGIILSKTLEEKFFPEGNAKGQYVFSNDSIPTLVSGVTNVMKEHPYSKPKSYFFLPFKEQSLLKKNENEIRQTTEICFRTRTKHSSKDFAADFKKEMYSQLAIGNYFLADIQPLEDLERFQMKTEGVYETLQNRTAFTLFFLLNIFLGIIGTFWLRIEKRKEEIGIRIAVGSTRKQIRIQLLNESFILMIIAVVPALLIWVNIIRLELLSTSLLAVTPERIFINTCVTLFLTGVAIAAGTWYPAHRSSAIEPAEALHYE